MPSRPYSECHKKQKKTKKTPKKRKENKFKEHHELHQSSCSWMLQARATLLHCCSTDCHRTVIRLFQAVLMVWSGNDREVRTRSVTTLLQDRVSQKPHVSYSSLAQGRAAMTTSRNVHVRVAVATPRTHEIAGSAMYKKSVNCEWFMTMFLKKRSHWLATFVLFPFSACRTRAPRRNLGVTSYLAPPLLLTTAPCSCQ